VVKPNLKGQKMKPTLLITAGLLITAKMAFAAVTVDSIAADLAAQGYTHIEIKQSNGKISVEGTLGADRVETVYDAATGEVLRTHISGKDSDGSEMNDHSGQDHSESADDDSNDDDDHGSDHDSNDDSDHGGDHDSSDSDHDD
jgi:hypothetical protein